MCVGNGSAVMNRLSSYWSEEQKEEEEEKKIQNWNKPTNTGKSGVDSLAHQSWKRPPWRLYQISNYRNLNTRFW